MDITNAYVLAVEERAAVAGTTSGVYTFRQFVGAGVDKTQFVNACYLTNLTGDVLYVKLLMGANSIQRGRPLSRTAWLFGGTGWDFDGKLTATNTGTSLTENGASLTVGKHYRTHIDVDSFSITTGDLALSLGSAAGTGITAKGSYSEIIACAGTGYVSLVNSGTLTTSISKVLAEQLATATYGEYHLVVPHGETLDVTSDGRDVCYGVSLWVPTGADPSLINIVGRVRPGRNKVGAPA